MKSFYARPVIVQASRILSVKQIDIQGTYQLNLDDGTTEMADAGMTARHVPVKGDYLVIQEDGYKYLNPKEVFERKYAALCEDETLIMAGYATLRNLYTMVPESGTKKAAIGNLNDSELWAKKIFEKDAKHAAG